jgi:hypothetical protein
MKHLVIILTLAILTLPMFSQIQMFGKYTPKGTIEPDINVFSYAKKLDSVGIFKLTYFALVEKSWAEGLIGISYQPKKWCELGLMFGIETSPAIYRISSSIWLSGDKTSFSACLEKGDGSDNWWYKGVLKRNLGEKFALGLISWRYNGTGLLLEYKTKNSLVFWLNPAYDTEFQVNRLTAGIDIKI